MRADIPFAFLAGHQTRPAGNYWVRVDADFRFLELRSATGTAAYRVGLSGGQFAIKAVSATEGSLIFNRYGDVYVLEGASRPMSDYGLKVTPSKAAAEMAHPSGIAPTLVRVAIR